MTGSARWGQNLAEAHKPHGGKATRFQEISHCHWFGCRACGIAPVGGVAHARAGDKGNISSINLWIHEPRFYPQVKAQLTAERVKEAYPVLFHGRVERYEIEHLYGLNFVIHEALKGGVNTSLNLDAHDKSWSFLILDIELDETAQSPEPRPE